MTRSSSPPTPAFTGSSRASARPSGSATATRYVLVSGNYQSGVSVVDFTDPANAKEIAFADPAALSSTSLIGGGDWSSYWYDGRIYESDMKRGLIIWNLSDNAVAGAKKLGHLNPQTQETSFPLRGRRR
jgi:hypothetical protein